MPITLCLNPLSDQFIIQSLIFSSWIQNKNARTSVGKDLWHCWFARILNIKKKNRNNFYLLPPSLEEGINVENRNLKFSGCAFFLLCVCWKIHDVKNLHFFHWLKYCSRKEMCCVFQPRHSIVSSKYHF